MHYLVAYDIRADHRRSKVLAALKDFGTPVQFSVVECELGPRRLALLKDRVLPLLHPRQDRLAIYALCDACFFRAERYGAERKLSL
jgi:CRISPR-associated protein Cas2